VTSFDHHNFLKNLSNRPGVYQMFNASGEILYVGKARNLKKRLSSYFRKHLDSAKTAALVSKIADIQVTLVASDTEALLLEYSLIREQKPPYNILLKDDKSFPYIYISTDQTYPKIGFHRGAKKGKGRYIGPFPNSHAVRESLALLQKTFRVRQCEDSYFSNRSRPCLQYQIDRCSGPCTQQISADEYRQDVERSIRLLEGRSEQLVAELTTEMEQYSLDLEFEQAAIRRDQIGHLRVLQTEQFVEGGRGDVDIFVVRAKGSICCMQLLYVRDGRILGARNWFQRRRVEHDETLLEELIQQYYMPLAAESLPKEIVVEQTTEVTDTLQGILAERLGTKMAIRSDVRGYRKQWLERAIDSAEQNLAAKVDSSDRYGQRLDELTEVLGEDRRVSRIECFDISHSSGEATVASCVVFDETGPSKTDYRRFNIEGIKAGDDYAAMAQAIRRRYTAILNGEIARPDLLLIDGGKGQLSSVRDVFDELQLTGLRVIGVAKGVTRKPGFETLFELDGTAIADLEPHSAALHLIQQVRDEAHRFAVTGHKQRRDKTRKSSSLEKVEGVGPKKRKALLRYFGGLDAIKKASVDDLTKVDGISKNIAQTIFDTFH